MPSFSLFWFIVGAAVGYLVLGHLLAKVRGA